MVLWEPPARFTGSCCSALMTTRYCTQDGGLHAGLGDRICCPPWWWPLGDLSVGSKPPASIFCQYNEARKLSKKNAITSIQGFWKCSGFALIRKCSRKFYLARNGRNVSGMSLHS